MRWRPALVLSLATVLWLGGCATRAPWDDEPVESTSVPAPSDATPSEAGPEIERGMASWYGEEFHGRRTASGEPFSKHEFTAAHKTLPFGTRVRVRHAKNGKEVTVRINDRGPFSRGRVIDLSRAAASAIGLTRSGVAPVVVFRE
ncbi:septal ring lytic transglycosylase RlpA family protein [Hydrogenophaga sp.]|uniref:septal ring lytic transglycosylase RlpA family protein n=1 Tax=Hydrogenophaga sp. TaxID=1904254 RepID=UPI00351D45C3